MPTKEQSFGNLEFKWNPEFKWAALPEATQHFFTPYQLGRKLGSFSGDLIAKIAPYLGGAALGGTAGYLASKKNKSRNTILGILAGLGAATGYDYLSHPEPTPIAPPKANGDVPQAAIQPPKQTLNGTQKVNPAPISSNNLSTNEVTSEQTPNHLLGMDEILEGFKKNPSNYNRQNDLNRLVENTLGSPEEQGTLFNEIQKRGLIPLLPRELSPDLPVGLNLINQKRIINGLKYIDSPDFFSQKAQFESQNDSSPFMENVVNLGTSMLPGFAIPPLVAASHATKMNENLDANIPIGKASLAAFLGSMLFSQGRQSLSNLVGNIANPSSFNPFNIKNLGALGDRVNRIGPGLVGFNALMDVLPAAINAYKAKNLSVFGNSLQNQNIAFRGNIYDTLNVSDNNLNPFTYRDITPAEHLKLLWDYGNKLVAHPVSTAVQTGNVLAKGIEDVAYPNGSLASIPLAANGLRYMQKQPENIQKILKRITPQELFQLDETTQGPFNLSVDTNGLAPINNKIDLMKKDFAAQGIPEADMRRIMGVYLGGVNVDDVFKSQRSLWKN